MSKRSKLFILQIFLISATAWADVDLTEVPTHALFDELGRRTGTPAAFAEVFFSCADDGLKFQVATVSRKLAESKVSQIYDSYCQPQAEYLQGHFVKMEEYNKAFVCKDSPGKGHALQTVVFTRGPQVEEVQGPERTFKRFEDCFAVAKSLMEKR